MAKAASIEVWGTGKPVREFIYVEDCADAIVLAAEKYNDVTMPLNIGTGIGTSIRELVETTNTVTGYRGKIVWNTDKPDGAMVKVLDVTRMKQVLDGWVASNRPQGRPGQDDRLVPGQQGPGGCEMVIAGAADGSEPRIRSRTRSDRAVEPGRRSVRLDRARSRPGTAAGRRSVGAAPPSDELGRQATSCSSTSITGPTTPRRPSTWPTWPNHWPSRLRVPRAVRHRAATSRESRDRPRMRFTRACTSTGSRRRRSGRRGTWARMTDYLSFYAGAVFKALMLPRFDAVVTLTTPPIIGLVGTLLKWLRGTRHVYWSMDLHPDASLALGRMSPSQPVSAIHALAERLRLSPGRQGGRARSVHGRPDRAQAGRRRADRDDPGLEPPRGDLPDPARANPLRKSLGLDDAFVAMYSGNLGLAHSFDEFLSAARRLRDRADIVFLFVGGGPRLARSRSRPRARGTHQHPPARLLPPRPVARLALAGRRPPDLDEARDDRDRRAGQALRRHGRGPAGDLRRSRALRNRRYDPARRLRLHDRARRRRGPGLGTHAPGRRSQPGKTHG